MLPHDTLVQNSRFFAQNVKSFRLVRHKDGRKLNDTIVAYFSVKYTRMDSNVSIQCQKVVIEKTLYSLSTITSHSLY